MTLDEMIALGRLISKDTDPNPDAQLWKDDEWKEFATRSQQEAARRGRLLVDSTTDEITLLEIGEAEASALRDPRILFIRRAKVVGGDVLRRVSYKTLDQSSPHWEEEIGPPRGYVPDFDSSVFRVYPMPDAAIQVRLTVVRLPLVDLTDGEQVPEIAPHLHRSLVEGMLMYAYSKVDSETFAPDRAAVHEAAFVREFGPASSAIDENWLERNHDMLEDEGNF